MSDAIKPSGTKEELKIIKDPNGSDERLVTNIVDEYDFGKL